MEVPADDLAMAHESTKGSIVETVTNCWTDLRCWKLRRDTESARLNCGERYWAKD